MVLHNVSGLFTDLWALGVMLYEMATGKKLFDSDNVLEIFSKIADLEIKFPKNIDPDLKDLIQKLVVSNPIDRLGFKNFSKLKNHGFFSDINWKQVSEKQIQSPLIELQASARNYQGQLHLSII